VLLRFGIFNTFAQSVTYYATLKFPTDKLFQNVVSKGCFWAEEGFFIKKKEASLYSAVVFPQHNMSYCSVSSVTASLCHQIYLLNFSVLTLYFELFEKSKYLLIELQGGKHLL